MEITTLILTSAVVSAFITGFAGYLASRRENMLKYITEERKIWRNEMRGIADDIEKAQPDNMGKELTMLKVRINAYGNTQPDNCHKDGHIWSLIKKLEKEHGDSEGYIQKKRLLVAYISLLLKDDWERSKEEVRGTFEKILQILLILFSAAVFAFYYFVQWKMTDITEFAVHTAYLTLTALFVTLGFRFLNGWALSSQSNKRKRLGSLAASLILYASLTIWTGYFFFQRWTAWPTDDRFVILTCIYIGFSINLLELVKGLQTRYAYEAAVRKLQKEGGEANANV